MTRTTPKTYQVGFWAEGSDPRGDNIALLSFPTAELAHQAISSLPNAGLGFFGFVLKSKDNLVKVHSYKKSNSTEWQKADSHYISNNI